MKKIKFLAIAVAAMIVGLTSCNKDNNIDVDGAGQTKNVTLLLEKSTPGSRAVDGSAFGDGTTGAVTTLSSGQIFFVKTATQEIKAIYDISVGATAGSNVNITDLTTGSGVTFANVDGDYVYVLGNKTVAVSRGEHFEDKVLKAVMAEADLSGGKYETAVLFGNGQILAKAAGTDGPSLFGAKVTIAPVAARIEIKKITEISATADYTYELEGIYINNYYETLTMNGLTYGTKKLNVLNTALTTDYTGAESTWHNLILDNTAAKTSNAGVDKVWAFNIFPAKSLATGDDLIPHIIVHLENVSKAGVVIYPNLYLTIDTYNGTDNFKAGNVYTIDDLQFDATKNGDPILETKKFNCDVKVTTLAWQPNTLVPELN